MSKIEGNKTLIPGLPDDIGLEILARVPRKYYSPSLAGVSSSWRETVRSPGLFGVRKRVQATESWLYIAVACEQENRPCVLWFARDATSNTAWLSLPLMSAEHRPIYGFRCATVGELLFVLGGCEWQNNQARILPATNKVSVFDARTNRWSCVEAMTNARANFACSVLDGNLFVAGGDGFLHVGAENFDDEEELDGINYNCLQSAERYSPVTNRWTPVGNMKHAKHFVSGSVVGGKFAVSGFVCEEGLQFREVTEIFEASKNRWEEVEKMEEEMGNESLFGMDEHSPFPDGNRSSHDPPLIIRPSSSAAPNVLVELVRSREEESEMKEYECRGILQACVEIIL